jgi:hypothetical protein
MSQTSYLEKYGTVAGAPWQEGKAPIVRFVTDDHKVIGVMFGHITRTYEDRLGQYLMHKLRRRTEEELDTETMAEEG